MKMSHQLTTFGKLHGGDTFLFEDGTNIGNFVKMAIYGDTAGTIHGCKPKNAVSLNNGDLMFFKDTDKVLKENY